MPSRRVVTGLLCLYINVNLNALLTSSACSIGGRDDTFVYDDTWAYDTKTRQWTELSCSGHIISPRVEHAAAIVDDIIYVFGGRGADGRYLGELAAFTISSKLQSAGHHVNGLISHPRRAMVQIPTNRSCAQRSLGS